MGKRNERTLRGGRVLRRMQYVVITMKGIQFVEKWYSAQHIPPHLTRLYRLLLRLIWMNGTMTANLARRPGLSNKVLTLASTQGYVEIHNKLRRPSQVVHNKICAMIGAAPRYIYA